MILSGKTIQDHVNDNLISITPFQEISIQPASVDLRLGKEFLIVDDVSSPNLSTEQPANYREMEVTEKGVIMIPPQTFLLGTTLE